MKQEKNITSKSTENTTNGHSEQSKKYQKDNKLKATGTVDYQAALKLKII